MMLKTATKSATAAAVFMAPGMALAHETGAPHGPEAHVAIYAGFAALLAGVSLAIVRLTRRRAPKRVRVERRDQPDRARRG